MEEPNFIFASLIKMQITVICPSFVAEISFKRQLVFISLLCRHNFSTKHQVSTHLTFPHCDSRDFISDMITTYLSTKHAIPFLPYP